MSMFTDDPCQTTCYSMDGEGFPLIMIHGVGLDHTMWELQVAEFSKQYKVICYDMMGHGNSFKLPGPFTLTQYVDQLDDFMKALGIERAHLLGFSMGGLVAQAFAVRHTERVASLMIVSCVAARTEEQRQAVLGRVAEVERYGHRATIDAAIYRWFDERFISLHPRIVHKIRQRLEDNDSASYLASYQVFAMADVELSAALQRIECPALIVTGDLDRGSTPEMAKLMAEQIPNSHVVILPDTRHMLPIESAVRFNQEVLMFLRAHCRDL